MRFFKVRPKISLRKEVNMEKEVTEKIDRVRNLMKEEELEGVLITSTPNFFWITGGKSGFVDKGVQDSAVKILITIDKMYLICNSSERYRVLDEELTDGSYEPIAFKWHENEKEILKPYLEGKKIGSDSGIYDTKNIAEEIQKLRYSLTSDEEIRMREIGPESAQILEDTMRSIVSGETEREIAGRVTGRLMAMGYQVPVCLVASDERMYKYRHPLPTDKKIKKYAMIAICAQKYGLM